MNLSAISSQSGMYQLIELDHAPKLANQLGLDLKTEANVDQIKKLLIKLGQQLSEDSSGLILDPIYSFPLSFKKKPNTGTLLRISTLNDEVDPFALPTLMPNWSVEDVANNYSLAKLELYYHPQEGKALEKKQLVAEIYDYCDYLDIEFLLKLIIYNPQPEKEEKFSLEEAQLQAVQEFRGTANIIGLQNPQGALAAATITAELDIPWLLADQADDYDQLKHNLRVCLENGAQGFMIDQALWAEIQSYKHPDQSPDWSKIDQFINTVVSDRAIELRRITDEYGEK